MTNPRKTFKFAPHTHNNQCVLVFSNQTSVPLPFCIRKMWPLITRKKWTESEREKENTALRSLKLQREIKRHHHLKSGHIESSSFFPSFGRHTQNNPDGDYEGEIRNLFNFSIWWLFPRTVGRSIKFSLWQSQMRRKIQSGTLFYYAPASNDSQISMMLTTSSFDLKWCKILDRS